MQNITILSIGLHNSVSIFSFFKQPAKIFINYYFSFFKFQIKNRPKSLSFFWISTPALSHQLSFFRLLQIFPYFPLFFTIYSCFLHIPRHFEMFCYVFLRFRLYFLHYFLLCSLPRFFLCFILLRLSLFLYLSFFTVKKAFPIPFQLLSQQIYSS